MVTLTMTDPGVDDLFTREFKYYKARAIIPDFSNVINFTGANTNSEEYSEHQLSHNNVKYEKYGLMPADTWQVFTFIKRKGLIFIRNPYTGAGHRYWAVRCLRDFPRKPHKLNIDIHGDLQNSEDWWDACHAEDEEKNIRLRRKLRWTTLGYHHDWDTKLYTENNQHPFPTDLSEMCKLIAAHVGFDDFIPQASIINYYHMDSTLAAHTDHSEENLKAPLLSLSFGQSAIFLIGGETKETKPTAIYLHSGDILIMSKECRLCYHAVPRIVEAKEKPWKFENISKNDTEDKTNLIEDIFDESFWKPFEDYLKHSRINMNIRQVLHKNQKKLGNVSSNILNKH